MLAYLIKILIIFVGVAIGGYPFFRKLLNKEYKPSIKSYGGFGLVGFIIFCVSFGFYYIPEKNSGHVTTKIGTPLSSGQLIARTSKGERGLQSELLPPGLGYNIKYPFLMDIEFVPDYEVPAGKFAVLTARDGKMNPNIVAKKWTEDDDPQKMLNDFEYFMEHGGERGIQQYILTTGVYRLNQYQWKNIKQHKLTEVKANEVLVIESKFGKAPAFKQTSDDEILSVPLVESTDYRGIVNNAYPSGYYAIHPNTQEAHSVSIVLETFIYGGGYTSEVMNLMIDPDNDKLQTVRDEIKVDIDKHGGAFEAKTKDNHTVRYHVRVLGQIEPVQAPRFIGTIRDPEVLDDKVIEPFTRNILTNITLEYDALELKDKKEDIGNRVSKLLRERTIKTGFRTKTVEITNIDIPPIVLIPGKIESASKALKDALVEKEKSVEQAIKVRNMQDQADSQEELAKATVANKAADQKAESIEKLSLANKIKSNNEADAKAYDVEKKAAASRKRLEEMASGAEKLVAIIGQEATAEILLQETINNGAENYDVPEVLVMGGGSSEGTDIVGAHMISKSIKESLNNK